MEPILKTWTSLEQKWKIAALACAGMAALIVIGLISLQNKESYQLLYSDLDLQSSGQIIAELEAQNIPYSAKGNGIFVPSTQVAALRMNLAAKGLPQNTTAGYELLDGLSGFGTTSRMYNVAYIRALEGELVRTIASNDDIKTARVHIAVDQRSSFLKSAPATASAVLFAEPGAVITPQRANAIQHLVAAAVTGLDAKDVEVLDHTGNLLSQELSTAAQASQVEQTVREKLMRLLEARVGQGNAVVEVSIRQNPTQEVIREKIIDPESRVAIAQEIEESSNERSNAAASVGVASNLPETQNSNISGIDSESRMRESVSYEISQKERETIHAPGGIDRMSIAVLINQAAFADDGTSRSSGLAKIQELVASAAGVDVARGDVVTVETMPFSATAPLTLPAQSEPIQTASPVNVPLMGAFVVALIALIGGLVAYRQRKTAQPVEQTTPANGSILDPEAPPAAVPQIDPEQRLRALIGENEDRTVMLLKSWLEEGEKA